MRHDALAAMQFENRRICPATRLQYPAVLVFKVRPGRGGALGLTQLCFKIVAINMSRGEASRCQCRIDVIAQPVGEMAGRFRIGAHRRRAHVQ